MSLDMRVTRISLFFFGAFLLLLAAGLLFHSEWLLDRWLWSDASSLSYIFMASVFSGFAFGYFMVAIQGKWRPLRNIAIPGLVSFGGWAIYLFYRSVQSIGSDDQVLFATWGKLSLIYAIINAIYCAASGHSKFTKTERIPISLRWILGFLVAVNLWVSLRLLVADDAFIWKLTPDMAVTYGWALFAAAILFFMGCLEPYWESAWSIFALFVPYDIILLCPLIYLLFHPDFVVFNPLLNVIGIILLLGQLLVVAGYSLYYHKSK